VFTLGCEVAVVLFATNSRHTYSEEHHGILNTLRFDELFQRLADGMKPKICFDIYGCSPRQPWKFYLTIQSIGLISVGYALDIVVSLCAMNNLLLVVVLNGIGPLYVCVAMTLAVYLFLSFFLLLSRLLQNRISMHQHQPSQTFGEYTNRADFVSSMALALCEMGAMLWMVHMVVLQIVGADIDAYVATRVGVYVCATTLYLLIGLLRYFSPGADSPIHCFLMIFVFQYCCSVFLLWSAKCDDNFNYVNTCVTGVNCTYMNTTQVNWQTLNEYRNTNAIAARVEYLKSGPALWFGFFYG